VSGKRNVTVVDNSHVARAVGERIRRARLHAGLTQAALSRGRYTSAYISALERGLAKPSMAALTFIAERLGVAVPDLVAEERPTVRRLEADLLSASGAYQEALDQYDDLLEIAGDDRRNRAELLRGRSEALCRLDRGPEAIRSASEAAELFDSIGAPADAAWARYWLAFGQYQSDNPAEARDILLQLLAQERSGLSIAPDFRFRLLTALGNVETWDGQSARGLTYMEEAHTLLGGASLRQRAGFLSALSLQYRRVGDLERSLRTGYESLALYRASEAEREEAALENNLALTFLELGNHARAAEHLERARELAELHEDGRLLSEVTEAEARLAFHRGDDSVATERALEAITAAESGGSYHAAVGAHLTLARIASRQEDRERTEAEFEAATALLRDHRAPSHLRDVLAEWADIRSRWGDLAGANALYAEALGRTSSASA
jgi:tetratricopeptide (TPR) repeat protein